MDRRRLAVIHCNVGIEWHRRRVDDFARGLEVLGFDVVVTDRQHRQWRDAPATLFGTTLWQEIERTSSNWLLVDRASVGDPDYVTLGWNGRGRLANYKVPEDFDESRWRALGVELQPLRGPGEAVILCGEADGRYPDVYGTHFRPHPVSGNPTDLPTVTDWIDGTYHVLRSSVAVDAIIRGYTTHVHDQSSLAYCVQDRERWAHWLAWTQWSWDEIRQGHPIGHLFA